MQWLPNQDWREAAFTFNWWQMQPSCQKFIRATCKLLIPTSFIYLTLNMITKNQTSLHFQLFLCCTSDDSAQFIDSDIVAYKLVCDSVANCPAAFLSYFHCGFVMKYSWQIQRTQWAIHVGWVGQFTRSTHARIFWPFFKKCIFGK